MAMACMIASGSLPLPSRWLAKDSGAVRALVRSRAKVVAMPRTSSAPGGGRSSSTSTARPSGGSTSCLQPVVQVLDEPVDLTPPVGQPAGTRLAGPARQQPIVGEPGLAPLLDALPAADQLAQRLVVGSLADLKTADPVEPRGEKCAGHWAHLRIHGQDVLPECTPIPGRQSFALVLAFLRPVLQAIAVSLHWALDPGMARRHVELGNHEVVEEGRALHRQGEQPRVFKNLQDLGRR